MIVKRLCTVGFGVAALVALSTGVASAGEVKGPPNQINNTNETGALDHANSACAASGLNDFDTHDPIGQRGRRSPVPPLHRPSLPGAPWGSP
jgi:hypothetical protein